MKNLRNRRLSRRLVAGIRGERLLLNPALRGQIVSQWRDRIAEAPSAKWLRMFPGFDPRCPADFGLGADLRAFLRSVECERLAEFLLGQGLTAAALGAFRDAAFAALDGAGYDHGEFSLPSRFLRIRFYALLDRIRSCEEEDPRLAGLGADPDLQREARRLGGESL